MQSHTHTPDITFAALFVYVAPTVTLFIVITRQMTASRKPPPNKSSKDLSKCSINVASQFHTERESDRFLHAKFKVFEEIETDQESSGSSEDMESPRSVSKVRKWPLKNLSVRVHSQILKIREEDSHLGEDVVGEYCLISARDKVADHDDVAAVVVFPRPTLPASPLSGKAAFKRTH